MVELSPQVGTNTVALPGAPQEFPPVIVCAKPLPCPDHESSPMTPAEALAKGHRLLETSRRRDQAALALEPLAGGSRRQPSRSVTGGSTSESIKAADDNDPERQS